MLKIRILLLALLLVCLNTQAQVIEPKNTSAEWSKAYPPFQIAGNLYYVGTYDLACYLITTEQGHILINTGLAASEAQIKKNIETLGFAFLDIRILLTTQAHYDHMGAMASIKKATGARMMVNEKDAPVMQDGGKSDYALGGNASMFEPVLPDRLLKNGDTITLDQFQMTILHHPGHTKGSSSFLFDVKDAQKSYRVLIANMPSIVTEKDFSQIAEYPDIANDYAYTLQVMKGLSFDIWLSSHASQFGLHSKHKPDQKYNPAAFFDNKGYKTAIRNLEKEFSKKVSRN